MASSKGLALPMVMIISSVSKRGQVIAQFLIICSTLIFLALGGHIIVISLLLESFQLMPIGEMFEAQPLMALIIQWSSMMFLGAVLLALPIMVSLLLINIGLGVITRAAPALNIFAVGFPAMILAGIILLSMSMSSIGFRIQWLWQESFKIMNQALGVA